MTAEEAAKLAASLTWQCPLEEIVSDDLTARFPWARRHSLILVAPRGKASMYVAVDQEGQAVPFPNQADPLRNLEALNALLQREGVRLPGGLEPEELARTVRILVRGPRGFVGSAAFWARHKDRLQLWTHPSPVEGPELFQRYCRDPQLHQSDREWTLQFSYFNSQGGVEAWNVAGDPGRIREAAFSFAVPNGTFLFPYV
jgi:hypothetical protein